MFPRNSQIDFFSRRGLPIFLFIFSIGSSLAFDNDWMTTKIDFDSLGDITDVIVGEFQQPESIDGGDGGPIKAGAQPDQISTSLKNNSTPSPPVAPTSPEQNVPNTELTLESTAHMNNFINAVCSGRITMEFPDLPCSNRYNPTQKTSSISENLELSQEILNPSSFKNITKSKSFQDLQDSLLSDENYNQGSVDSSDSVCEVAVSPVSVKKVVQATAPKLRCKTKQKTPEQKQRKQLQNRNAATRYRSKKRKEQDVLNDECEKLEQENKKLRTKVENLEQETQYLKNLIVDIYDKKIS